ncbi:MAG TPA: CoA-binding protein [Chloroflexota bacterium]|jgi:predicted CoA-binding protein|nr:CoA-binding protein [Chloroflexota bacterium]
MDVQNPPDEVIRSILEQYRHVAVVGLSDQPDRPSYGVAAYLQRAGYTITPVNPTIRQTLGVAAVPSLEEAPPPLEIVDVFRRPEHVPGVVDQAIALGAKVVWLQLGIVNEAAAATARAAGLTVVQDRCIFREHQRLLGARAAPPA